MTQHASRALKHGMEKESPCVPWTQLGKLGAGATVPMPDTSYLRRGPGFLSQRLGPGGSPRLDSPVLSPTAMSPLQAFCKFSCGAER